MVYNGNDSGDGLKSGDGLNSGNRRYAMTSETESIQWFPGHMAKTRRLMTENLRLVDVVVEMIDARLPQSSRNPLINELAGAKPRVLVMAKADLAEEAYNRAWVAFFREQGIAAIPCDLKGKNASRDIKAVAEEIRARSLPALARRSARGINDRTVRAMITGIPNVGKSTLINRFSGRTSAKTADRPGVTKGKQWVKMENDIDLLDMPGILWPNLEDREAARKLAVTGAIGENAYSQLDLVLWAISWLRARRPGRIESRYGVDETTGEKRLADYEAQAGLDPGASQRLADPSRADLNRVDPGRVSEDNRAGEDIRTYDNESLTVLENIGRKRGFLRKGGVVELDKTAAVALDELRGGKLGRITWDEPPAMND